MLEKYRSQIDEIDFQIINLLAKRFKIVKEIWNYKKNNNIAIVQYNRWNNVLITRKELAKKLWINEDLIEKIWNLIHNEAIMLEKKK